jgi:Na+/melibiose symporter-like transporter
MTTEDHELQAWKQEWQAEVAGPLPQLKKRVRLQTARMIASNLIGLILGVGVLIYAARAVRRHPTPQTIVWGAAVLLFLLASGIFIVWNQIGIWRVETHSTLAYAELSYKRALTKIRKTRFILVIIVCEAAFDLAYIVWSDWLQTGFHPGVFVIDLTRGSAALLATWLFVKWYGRRKAHQLEQARRFMEELQR